MYCILKYSKLKKILRKSKKKCLLYLLKKNLYVSGLAPFKFMLFMGRQYVF